MESVLTVPPNCVQMRTNLTLHGHNYFRAFIGKHTNKLVVANFPKIGWKRIYSRRRLNFIIVPQREPTDVKGPMMEVTHRYPIKNVVAAL